MKTNNIGKKSLIGLTILSVGLAACAPSVDGWQLLAAEKACSQRGGIDHIQTFIGTMAICRDGFIVNPKLGG